MTQLRNVKGDEQKQFWLLRRYLRQKDVNVDLKQRIIRYLEWRCQNILQEVQASNIKILALLSEPLSNELHSFMFAPHLKRHPFFHFLGDNMSSVMHRVCHQSLRGQSLAAYDVLFALGDEGRCMYFVKNGDLQYTFRNGDMLDPPLKELEWVAEAVLWVSWWHAGELSAVTPCDLVVVDPKIFMGIFCQHIKPWRFAKRYADQFLERLNNSHDDTLSDIIRDDAFYSGAMARALSGDELLSLEMYQQNGLEDDLSDTSDAKMLPKQPSGRSRYSGGAGSK